MLSPTASTNPSPSVITPGLRLPRRQPLYSWQFTRSRPTSSQMTTNNSLLSSKTPSTKLKQSRWARPGTLTRTELQGYPSRPFRWLSPLSQTTFPSFSQPSSSSQSGSRLRKRRKLTATPNASTATVSDTPMPDAPRNTQLVPIAHYIILAQHTNARTPPAPRAATPTRSLAAAPPPLPTARIAVTTTMPSPENAGLDQSPLLNQWPPQLPTKSYPTSPPIVRKLGMWATMATQHPLLQKPPQPKLSTFPPPDPPSKLETPPLPPMGPSQHPLPGPSTSDSL